MKNQNLYLNALLSKYKAQQDEAVAALDLYFNSAVGIGEHSDLLVEYDKWVTQLADAEGKINTLMTLYPNGLEKK